MTPQDQANQIADVADKLLRGSKLRDLERDLDGWFVNHREDVFTDGPNVPMMEFEQDTGYLFDAARAIAEASIAIAKLTQNNISSDGNARQDPEAISDLIAEQVYDLLSKSAGNVLSAAIAVRLAGGRI